jgi:hypothetical protein
LIQFARFIVFQDEDASPIMSAVVDIQQRKGTFYGRIPGINMPVEVAAWVLIRERVQACIERFPTTLEQDRALIAKDDTEHTLTSNQRNCVNFRMGEKIIYHNLIACADAAARFATMSEKDIKAEILTWEGQ